MTDLIEAMGAEFKANLSAIMDGNDPHEEILLDTLTGYREMLTARYVALQKAPEAVHPPTIETIQGVVAGFAGVPVETMRQDSKQRCFVRPRWAAMFIASNRYGFSAAQIGRRFDRDHTTVLYALNAMAELRGKDAKLRNMIEQSILALEAA